MHGITRFSVVMTVGATLCIAVVFFVLSVRHQATLRDIQRLSDMRQAEFALTALYTGSGSFLQAAQNGCNKPDMLLSECNFATTGIDASTLRDPGRYRYTVKDVPSATGYAILFTLEQSHGNLKAGVHRLTQQGIQ